MDLAKARRFVMEAKDELGLPVNEPIKTTFTVNGSNPLLVNVADQYVRNLAEIGIDAELIVSSVAEWAKIGEGDYTGLTMSYNGGWLDADDIFYGRYHSDSMSNFIGVSDPHLDALIIKGRSVHDTAERMQIYFEVQKYLADMQYDFAVPNGIREFLYPEWVINPGPSLEQNVGDMWLEAWIDMSHPSRNSHE